MHAPLTINDFLDRAVAAFPHRTALIDDPAIESDPLTLSYGDLGQVRASVGAALDALGIGFGERIAIVTHNSSRMASLLFGVPGNGRILVPVNARLSAAEVQHIVDHSGAKVLLVDQRLASLLGEVTAPHAEVLGGSFDERWFGQTASPEPWIADESALATINYTSGTTSQPKGVEQTHRARWLNGVVWGWQMGIGDRDVFLHVVPMYHVDGWGVPFPLAAMGVKQVMVRQADGHRILELIQEHGVTVLGAAPTVAQRILDAARSKRTDLPGAGTVRIQLAGSAPGARLIEELQGTLGWEVIHSYGLTETAPLLTMNRAPLEWDGVGSDEHAQRLARAGVPALGMRVEISADGEVLTRGHHVLQRYWSDTPATDEAFSNGWFRTGDLGAIDDDGYLRIADRLKDVIISGGENVSAAHVEEALLNHPGVAEVAVIGIPDPRWGETVKAIVVPATGRDPSADELILHCRRWLAGFECPTSIDFRTSLPRTATGKVRKSELRAAFWGKESDQDGQP